MKWSRVKNEWEWEWEKKEMNDWTIGTQVLTLPWREQQCSAYGPTDCLQNSRISFPTFPVSPRLPTHPWFFFYLFCLLCWFSLFQFAFVDSVFHVFYVNFYAGTDNYLNKTEDQIKNRNQRSRVVLSVVGFSIFSTSRNFHSGMESWTKKSVNRGGIRESKNKICFTVTGEEISSYFQH